MKKTSNPPLNQATPILTGKFAKEFLKNMEKTSKEAREYKKNNPEEYELEIKKRKDNLEKILKKAKL